MTSFDPILFLYLQPELQVTHKLDTVEKAHAFYQDNKALAEEQGWVWDLDFLPPRFHARLFIAQIKNDIALSEINSTIKDAVQTEQGIDTSHLLANAQYVPTLYFDGKVFSQDTFIVQENDGSEYLHDGNLNPGDQVQVYLKSDLGFVKTLFVTVKERIDAKSFSIQESHLIKNAYIGTECLIFGIKIFNIDRLASIAYLRLEKRLGKPPSSLEHVDSSFNADLFRLLYPTKRNLDDATAYLEYIKQNKYDIGSAKDISSGKKKDSTLPSQTVFDKDTYVHQLYTPAISFEPMPESNVVDVPSNVETSFYNLHVDNTLHLNFANNTGYIRFNDQDVYYITTDDRRTSEETDPFFQGLITERGIKHYIDRKYLEEARFQDITVSGETIFKGDTVFGGNSNLFSNVYADSGEFQNIRMYDSVMSNVDVRDSKIQNVTLSHSTIADVVLSNVQFNQSTFSGRVITFDADMIFTSHATFCNQVDFYGPTNIHDALICQSNVKFESVFDAHDASVFHSNVSFRGDIQHTGNEIALGGDVVRILNHDTYRSVHVTGNGMHIHSPATFSNATIFKDSVTFHEKSVFQQETHFEKDGVFDADVFISGKAHFNTTNLSNMDLEELDVQSALNVHGSALFKDHVTFLSNVSFYDHATFDAPLTSLQRTKIHDLEVIDAFRVSPNTTFSKDVDIAQNLDVNNHATVKGSTKLHGPFETFDSTTFHRPVYHNDSAFFSNDVHILSNILFYEDVSLLSNDFRVRDVLSTQNDDVVTKGLRVTDDAVLEAALHLVGTELYAEVPSFFTRPVVLSNTTLTLSDGSTLFTDAGSVTDHHGKVHFSDTTHFKNDIFLEDSASIHGHVRCLSNIYVSGTTHIDTLKQFTNSNDAILVISPMTWKEESVFENDTTFLDRALFAQPATFESNVKFRGNVTFREPLSSLDVLDLAVSQRLFLDDTVYGSKDATFRGHMTWCNTNTFTENSPLQGYLKFVNNETHHHGPFTFYDDVHIRADAHFADGCNVVFSNGFTSHDDAYFEKSLYASCNLHFTHAHPRVFGAVTFWDEVIIQDTLTLDSNIVMNGDVLFNAPITFGVPVHIQDKLTIASDAQSVFSNTPVFEKRPHFHDGACISNNLHLISIDDSFTVEGEAQFQDKIVFQDDIRASSRAYIERLHVHEEADFEPHVNFSNTVAFLGTTDFFHDVNFSQQTIYGNPRFAEKVYFHDDVRAKKNVDVESKLEVHGRTTLHKTCFEDDVDFKDMRLMFSSNATLEGKLQVQGDVHTFCNLYVHGPADFDDRVSFHGEANFSNTATFGKRTVFRDDIMLVNKNHVYGDAVFESNIRFASGIAVAESLKAEGHIFTQHATVSNGRLDIERESKLYLHDDTDFIMENGGKAQFLNQETTFACPVHFENLVLHSNDVLFLQDAVFKSNVEFRGDVNGGDLSMSNVHVQDILTSCNCKVDVFQAVQASFVSAVGSDMGASNLYVTDTAEINKAIIDTGVMDVCTASQVDASNVQSKKMVTDLAEIVELLVQNDSTFANIRVTDNVRTQTISTCNVDTYELESVFIEASNIACHNGSFVNLDANRSSNDHMYAANAHLVHADAEDMHVMSLHARQGHLSNLMADEASLSNMFSLSATFDSLSAKGRSTLNDVFADRVQSRHTSFCNLTATDTVLENLEVRNVKIHQNFEQNTNSIAKFNNVSVVNACNDNLNVANMAHMNGETFFNDNSFFKSNAFFDAPVEVDGGLTVRGGGDKVNTLHNTELTTATLDGNVQFKSSPVMKNNLVIEGAMMSPRIGIGPYNKAFRLGTNIDMKNVIYLNSKTNTKVFGNRVAPQLGLNGGQGTLEVLFYNNAIVNLGQGMQTFDMYFSPQNILEEMIGQTGSITFIEKSIHGRNISFDNICVFASSENENNADSRVVRTTTESPDIYGGYALDIMTYTVLSKETILCDYKNISTVSGDRPGIKQELWLFSTASSLLYVHSIIRDDDSALKIMCSRKTNGFIEFSEDFYSNSSLEVTFVLHVNNKGQCTDISRVLYRQSIPDSASPVNATLRNDGKNMMWCVKMIHNANEEIISFDILDNQLNELKRLSSESTFKKQSIYALIFQDGAARVKWTRIIKNMDIVDHVVTGQKAYILGNGSILSNDITVHEDTGFKHNELDYKKAYVIHFDHSGVVKWFASISEKTVCLAIDEEDNIFIGYVRVPENPSSLVDGKGKKKEHNRYFQFDEGFSNVSLAKLDKDGGFRWFTQMISRGQHTLLAMEVLISADVVVCFHNDNIDPVYSYNGFDVYDKEVVPKDVGKDQVNLQSWESYLVLAKYNNNGITQWFSLISNVDTSLSNINKIMSPSTRGGFLVAFRPETKKHSVYQTTVFDAEIMVAFSMNADDTAGKNLIFIMRYSNKGKVIWRIELDQGDDESLLDDLAVTEIVDGGVCLASGKWSRDTIKSQLTDAEGNTRHYENFAIVKLNSRGVVVDDDS